MAPRARWCLCVSMPCFGVILPEAQLLLPPSHRQYPPCFAEALAGFVHPDRDGGAQPGAEGELLVFLTRPKDFLAERPCRTCG
mmetsp:Transcript_52984/g.123171  ORF Transcript_52984/g.123171 Transcript_52984/m.123171 type:complete len:83 (+) Transcript_52984:207-455(+)